MNKLLLAAVLLAGTALTSPASAATYTFTSDHCGNGGGQCGGTPNTQPDGFATITGTQIDPNTVSVTINPLYGNGLVGGATGLTTFSFNLVNNPTITYSFGTNPTGSLNSLFTVQNGTGAGGLTASAGTTQQTQIHQDGFGDFEYGFDYTKAPGGSDTFKNSLTFLLTSTSGLLLSQFSELSTGGDVAAFFALDILSGTTGKTGVVDCCVGQPTLFDVPIPAPLALFAAGLVGIGMLRRVIKKKQPELA